MNNTPVTLETTRNNLMSALESDTSYLQSLLKNTDPEEFKSALEELAATKHLVDSIPPKEIVRVAAQAASMGLSINPYHKECYILPFKVKGKGMVPSIVVSTNGAREMAFQHGFYLQTDAVWSIEGSVKKESEMSLEAKSSLDTTNAAFVKSNLLGWNFKISDVSTSDIKVPEQEVFVSLKFAIGVTKNMDAPDHSLMQAYVHKATRRAMGEFFIPRSRKASFLKMMKIDDENAIDVTPSSVTETTNPKKNAVDPLASIDDAQAVDAEIIESPEVLITHIKNEYRQSEPKRQACISDLMKSNSGWEDFNAGKLSALLEKVRGC